MAVAQTSWMIYSDSNVDQIWKQSGDYRLEVAIQFWLDVLGTKYIWSSQNVWLLMDVFGMFCSQVAKNAIKSHGTVLLYPYVCICYVFHVGIDSKFYSKVNRQNM